MTPFGWPEHRMARLAFTLLLAAACGEAESGAIGMVETGDSLIYSDTSPKGHVAELRQLTLPGGAAATRLTIAFDDVRCGEGSLLAAGGDLGLFPWWADDTTLVVFHPDGATLQESVTSDVVQCRDDQIRVLTEPLACGRVDVVGEYRLAHAGHAYRIPGMLEVQRDDVPLYRARHVHRWIPPLRSLVVGVADSLLLLRSSETDCVDRTRWSVAVVEPSGAVPVAVAVFVKLVWVSSHPATFTVSKTDPLSPTGRSLPAASS